MLVKFYFLETPLNDNLSCFGSLVGFLNEILLNQFRYNRAYLGSFIYGFAFLPMNYIVKIMQNNQGVIKRESNIPLGASFYS